jgi:hypothetical protein
MTCCVVGTVPTVVLPMIVGPSICHIRISPAVSSQDLHAYSPDSHQLLHCENACCIAHNTRKVGGLAIVEFKMRKMLLAGLAAAVVIASPVLAQAASGHHVHRHGHAWGAYAQPPAAAFGFIPGSEAYAQGSWHINQDGQAFQVPYDCAYPIGYDSGGAAIFDRSCPLP